MLDSQVVTLQAGFLNFRPAVNIPGGYVKSLTLCLLHRYMSTCNVHLSDEEEKNKKQKYNSQVYFFKSF